MPTQGEGLGPPTARAKFKAPIVFACVLALLVGIGSLLIVVIHSASLKAFEVQCSNNLSQLWKLQEMHARQSGSKGVMIDRTGEAFWLYLRETDPPIVDASMSGAFVCPVAGDQPGACAYRGPGKPVEQFVRADPVGADKPDNHRGNGGYVLLKDGSVHTCGKRDALWSECVTKLKP